jgi:7-keto-8-aminopelargonate synthetase-like enzyme
MEIQKKNGFYAYDRFIVKQGDSVHATLNDGEVIKDCVAWNTNTYLGLTKNKAVLEAAQRALLDFGTGTGASLPNGGPNAMHHELERRLARGLGKESVMIVPIGFTANLGVLGSILCDSEGDLFLSDKGNHASIIQGLRASTACVKRFHHNSVSHLRDQLQKYHCQ